MIPDSQETCVTTPSTSTLSAGPPSSDQKCHICFNPFDGRSTADKSSLTSCLRWVLKVNPAEERAAVFCQMCTRRLFSWERASHKYRSKLEANRSYRNGRVLNRSICIVCGTQKAPQLTFLPLWHELDSSSEGRPTEACQRLQTLLNIEVDFLVDAGFVCISCNQRMATLEAQRSTMQQDYNRVCDYFSCFSDQLKCATQQQNRSTTEDSSILFGKKLISLLPAPSDCGIGSFLAIRQDETLTCTSLITCERVDINIRRPSIELDCDSSHIVHSECLTMSVNILRAHQTASTVCHLHSKASTLVSCLPNQHDSFLCLRDLHILSWTGCKSSSSDNIIVPLVEDSETNLQDVLQQFPDANALLVRNHGVYVWGDCPSVVLQATSAYEFAFDVVFRRMCFAKYSSSNSCDCGSTYLV